MNKGIRVAILLLGAVALGYSLGTLQDHFGQREAVDRAVANATYDAYKSIGGGSGCSFGMSDKALQYIEPEVSKSLAHPWNPMRPIDDEWGVAFWVKNKFMPGAFGVNQPTGMTAARQDEMIRFLCYAIEYNCQHPLALNGRMVFRDLSRYARVTQPQHTAMLLRAVQKAVGSESVQLWQGAFEFISCQLAQQWAQNECWRCILWTSRENEMPSHTLDTLLGDIRQQADGNNPTFDGEAGQTPPATIAAAKKMLESFRDANWESLRVNSVRHTTLELQEKLRRKTTQPATDKE